MALLGKIRDRNNNSNRKRTRTRTKTKLEVKLKREVYDLLFYSRVQNRNFLDYWHFSLKEKQTVLNSVSLKKSEMEVCIFWWWKRSLALKGYVLPSMNTMGVGWLEWSFYVEQEHPPAWWVGSQFRLRFQLTSPHRLRPHPPLGQDWTRWTRHYHQWQYYLLHLGEGPKWHRGTRKTSMCNTQINAPPVKHTRGFSTNVRLDYSVKNCQHENWRPQNLQDTQPSWFEKYHKLNCNNHNFKLLREKGITPYHELGNVHTQGCSNRKPAS